MSQADETGEPGPAQAQESPVQGLPWVLSWTVAGALVPGLGLIAAGRRRIGGAVLGLLALGLLAVLVWVFRGDMPRRGLSFALDPQRLLYLAVAVIAGAVLWAVIVLVTSDQLQRNAGLARNQKVLSWAVAGILVLLAAVPTYVVADYSLVQRDLLTTVFDGEESADADLEDVKPDTVAVDPWAGTERVNVLLIGSDAGENREGVRPDTLIVASIQPSTGNTVLFSLPRNLERVPFKKDTPGDEAWPDGFWCANDECLLNAIWTWALDDPGYQEFRNPGLKATEDAVTGVTGLEIDTYVMLNLKGFEDFIDAVGGVTLNVYERLPMGGDSNNPSATFDHIEPGMNQEMDGFHALWFARSRWSTTDYDRMRRQRCVIAAVAEQADPVTLARNFTQIAGTLKDNMSTGIPRSEVQAWAELATRVQGAEVSSLPFTDDVVASRANPDYDLIHRQVRDAIKKSENDQPDSTPSATRRPTPAPSKDDSKDAAKDDSKEEEPEPDPTTAQDVTEVC